jgi:glycine/D-amino acid oxidase-like deaminating enzyme
MQRRTVIEMLAGIAVAGLPSIRVAAQRRRVVVAGAGVIGANIAYQLSKRGAAVTVLERHTPAMGATSNSFAWINAKKRPLDYFNLSRLGILAWRELDRQFAGRLPVRWGGGLEWQSSPDAAARMVDEIRGFQAWGYNGRRIDESQLKALEPKIAPGRVACGAHWEDEGHADPVGVTEVILGQAVSQGVDLRYPAEVVGLEMLNGRLRAVRSTKGDIEADVLVVACGVETPRVAAMAGVTVPLQGDNPGVLAHVVPQAPLVDRVILSPVGNIKQKPDGRIVVGSNFGQTSDRSLEAGGKMLQAVSAVLPSLGTAAIEKMTLGYRPIPKDGRPVIGFPNGRSDVYVAVMHSGMTLGALVGRFAATEILDGVAVEPLAQYRLERFTV